MPSKGSPKIVIRLPEEMVEEIETIISETNEKRRGEPWILSTWIRAAIAEKIAHVKRSRGQGEGIRHVEIGEEMRLTIAEN